MKTYLSLHQSFLFTELRLWNMSNKKHILQPVFICSESKMETLEQRVKSV